MQRPHHHIRIWEVGLALVAVFLFVGPAAARDAEHLQSWSQKIDDADRRFEVLVDFNDEAVLDKETQLVWEQSPFGGNFPWADLLDPSFVRGAQRHCYNREVGGRKGWRLPTVEELASLVDTSVAGSPKLPSGHPFSNVQSTLYFSATTLASDTTRAWLVVFGSGLVSSNPKAIPSKVWCVRGGHGHDGHGQ